MPPCLLSHAPVSLLILMLGTNDTKERFGLSAEEIARGMERLARQAMSEDCWGPGGPDLLVVAPPAIRPEVEHSPVAAAMGRGCAEKSRQLAEHYRRLAARLGARFLDGEGCELNRVDHMHLTQAGHAQLAARVGAVLSDPATGALGQ